MVALQGYQEGSLSATQLEEHLRIVVATPRASRGRSGWRPGTSRCSGHDLLDHDRTREGERLTPE